MIQLSRVRGHLFDLVIAGFDPDIESLEKLQEMQDVVQGPEMDKGEDSRMDSGEEYRWGKLEGEEALRCFHGITECHKAVKLNKAERDILAMASENNWQDPWLEKAGSLESQQFPTVLQRAKQMGASRIGYILDDSNDSLHGGHEEIVWLNDEAQRGTGMERGDQNAAKHYRVTQAFIREQVNEGTLKIEQVASTSNTTDILTKALGKVLFQKHRANLMGPQEPTKS